MVFGRQQLTRPLYAVMVCMAAVLMGCHGPVQRGENLLIVNFEEGKVLRYQMTSSRDVTIELTGSTTGTKQGQPQKMTESMELTMAYKPVKVDPFGLTRIECTFEAVKVNRSSFSGRGGTSSDAMESLQGKTFILELSPSGQIEDFSQLEQLLLDTGKAAFDTARNDLRVKNPDMIYDFVALQWYLWDSISSVPNPLDGVKPGMTWTNTQLIAWPVPIPNPPCRVTTFKLDSVVDENAQKKAVIASTYRLSDTTVANFPKPYEGTFQMRGLFGFLRDYKFQSLEGEGKQVFNLSTGTVESDTQKYLLKTTASFLLPLGDSVPHVAIEQTLRIQKLEP